MIESHEWVEEEKKEIQEALRGGLDSLYWRSKVPFSPPSRPEPSPSELRACFPTPRRFASPTPPVGSTSRASCADLDGVRACAMQRGPALTWAVPLPGDVQAVEAPDHGPGMLRACYAMSGTSLERMLLCDAAWRRMLCAARY
eukprot:609494-Rhodomonas_salina.1